MKKLFTLIAALVLGFNLNAQTITDEEVIVSPESIHLYFHGCSPHGERVTVTNHTSEDLIINRCYAENFIIEFLYEGENIAETGFVVPIGESVGFEVYATPTLKQENDIYGTIFIDTDFGVYTIALYYETTYGIDEQVARFNIAPVPANDFVSITGENLGKVSIYNAIGQRVEEFDTEGDNLRISATDYPNGIYFVRTAQGETRRFIIAH